MVKKTRPVWELPWLGMTAEDVRAAKKAGIEVDEIFHFWKGRTLKGLKKSFGFTDSMMNYLKRALVEIPGGVVQLKQETVERKEARSDG